MYSSLILNSSVKRKTGNNNYLISSESSEFEVEVNENEDLINTPQRKGKLLSDDEKCYHNKTEFNLYFPKPSVSLATSVRRKDYYIGSSDEREIEYNSDVEIENDYNSTLKIQQEIDNFFVQPCVHSRSEFEPCVSDLYTNYGGTMGTRRRNHNFNSDEEYNEHLNQRLSIKYQSSVKRKNNSRRLLNIIDSDTDEDLKQEFKNRRSSFCLGPELIDEKSKRSSSLESETAWISFESDFNSDLKNSSVDSFNDYEWKTAIDSLSDMECETKNRDSSDILDKHNLFSEDETIVPKVIEPAKDKKLNKKKGDEQVSFVKKRNSLVNFWYQIFNSKVFNNKLPSHIPIKWTGRLQRTAAQTLFITGNDGSKSVIIKLSKYVLDCEYRLKKTLLHECCHVAQFLLDSCIKPPHGQVFLKWGKIATRIYPELKVEIYHNYEIIYKYRYQCLRCHQIFGRQKKINNTYEAACSKCNGNIAFIGKGTLSGFSNYNNNESCEASEKSKNKVNKNKQNAYSDFVKEKFAEYKRDIFQGKTPSRRAPSILKEIAKLWNKTKTESLSDKLEKLSINS
ncbi:SprT family metallopeptidase [Cryptosporidium ryanae]|uniref:SprT family metallopeptidase n=1 Tax=Cryptosporidium ryanae TaxID=515981 RepID=UPI00351A15F8|nr:SprT family metallopeptidase [Cryptosporidium ryanae]